VGSPPDGAIIANTYSRRPKTPLPLQVYDRKQKMAEKGLCKRQLKEVVMGKDEETYKKQLKVAVMEREDNDYREGMSVERGMENLNGNSLEGES